MQSFWAMIVANLKMTVRNRQAIFWNLAFPAIFILIFGAVFGSDNLSSFDVGVVGPESALRADVVGGLESAQGFKVHVGSEADEMDALNNNDREVVLVVPAEISTASPIGYYYNQDGGPTGSIAQAAVISTLYGILGDPNEIAIEGHAVSTLNLSFIDFFVPGILAMSLMNSGVIGLSTAFVTYREKGILRRIKVTPFSLTSFILARIVTTLIVAVLQAVVLVGLGVAIYGMTLRGNPLLILLTIMIGGLAFLSIGFALSGMARNTETAASYANLVTFPMLFLSGTFFAIDSLPTWLQGITRILPLRYLVDALREPMMRGNGIDSTWVDLLVLLGVFVVAMAVAVRFFKWEARPT